MKTTTSVATLALSLLCTSGVATAITVPELSTFDTTLEGWTLTGDASSLAWDGPGGDPDGGYAWYSDMAAGAGFIKAPAKFLGDWSNLDGVGHLSFRRKILFTGCLDFPSQIVDEDVVIAGPGGRAHHVVPAMTGFGYWESVTISIDRAEWVLTGGVWEDLIANVNDLEIQIEMVDNECLPLDRDGIDTIALDITSPGEASNLEVRTLGGDLELTWTASCSQIVTDYSVYEGVLGDWTSHSPVACSTGGMNVVTITPSTGDHYYLVVPSGGGKEGSYGVNSTGGERPSSHVACFQVHDIGHCP